MNSEPHQNNSNICMNIKQHPQITINLLFFTNRFTEFLYYFFTTISKWMFNGI